MDQQAGEPRSRFSAEDILSSLYEVLLNRDPDAEGLAYWSDILDREGMGGHHVAAISTVLNNFIASAEAKRKLLGMLARDPDTGGAVRKAESAQASIRRGFLQPSLHRLPQIVPLGVNCYGASLLARFGARSWTGPFDWIFSTPAMVRDCLDDDFASFLDTSHYRYVPVEQRADPDYNRVSHDLFEGRYQIASPIFNHTDAHTEEGQRYLHRCVERLRAAMTSDEPVRFLQIDKPPPFAEREFRWSLAALQKHCQKPNFVQVVVSSAPVHTAASVQMLASDESGRLLEFRAGSHWQPTRFEDSLDDLILMRGIAAAFADMAADS